MRASPPRVLGGLVSAAGMLLVVSTLLVVPRDDLAFTTYAGASPTADVAEIAAGLALVGAAAVAWFVRPDRVAVRVALSVAAAAWFAPRWVGWEDGPAAARSMGMVLAPFLVPTVAHAVVASRPVRWTTGLVSVLYAWTGFVSLNLALVRDPFLDLTCWSNCSDNVFLVDPQPAVARLLVEAWSWTHVAVGCGLAVYGVGRLALGTSVLRRSWWPVLVAGALVGGALAAYGVTLLRLPIEDPGEPAFAVTHDLLALALTGLAAAITWAFVRAYRARRTIARVAADLGAAPAPGALRATLARGVGDASLVVGYPAPGGDRYVDAAGARVETTAPGRTATSLVRNGEEIAVVVNDAATDADLLRTELGAAALLAVENERLQARVLAELADLRASRARIVESADAERRTLERNLHDGAQQQLLALLYDVQLALAAARENGDSGLVESLEATRQHAREAVSELRELAHGIYPAVLTEAGLAAALWSLTDDLGLPVDLDAPEDVRFPESVERTAFVVVSQALDGVRRDSERVSIRISPTADALLVVLTGVSLDHDPHLADRVGAAGGELRSQGGRLEAVLPFAAPSEHPAGQAVSAL